VDYWVDVNYRLGKEPSLRGAATTCSISGSARNRTLPPIVLAYVPPGLASLSPWLCTGGARHVDPSACS